MSGHDRGQPLGAGRDTERSGGLPVVTGSAHLLGDDVDTDRIIAGKYTKTLDLSSLAEHLLEDYDPELAARIKPGDVLVAGENFGCGSSREQAPVAIKAAGVACVLARSFARIFYRNAINIGLSVVEVPDHRVEDGDTLTIDVNLGQVANATRSETYPATRMPPVMGLILAAGGLVPYLRAGGDYGAVAGSGDDAGGGATDRVEDSE